MLQTDGQTVSVTKKRRDIAVEDAVPHRRCIVTRESKPTKELVRFVASPDGLIVPDLAETLPGRGIWVSAEHASVCIAVEKKLFARAARRQVTVPLDLADQVGTQLLRRCHDLIGLARRGGGAVAGFEKVKAALSKGTGRLLLAAIDGADDGRTKLERLSGDVPVAAALTRQELGLAFGREQAVHAVVTSGKIADQLEAASRRLSGFRQQSAERGAG